MADPDLWFPGARLNQLAPVDGGSILGGRPKMLWHKTVTSGFPSYSTNFWPHFTLHPGTGEVRQHIPANRASRALRNLDGGVQTNRWNCLQVEVVGPVDDGDFHPVMADLALWAHDRCGVPLTTSVDWRRPYNNGQAPSSYGSWPGRLTGSEWSDYIGHLAHMHCPENVHGDTGWPFPITQILEGGDMAFTAEDEALLRALRDTVTGEGDFTTRMNTLSKIRGEIDLLQAAVADLHTKVDQLGSGAGGTLTRQDIEDVVRAVFADAATP
jgi:hypothetical protein